MIRHLLSNTVVRNFSVLTSTNMVIQLLSVLSSIRIARLLQPQGYGQYNLMLVQAGIFSVIASWGLSLVIIRYVARNRQDSKYIFLISNKIRIATTLLAILCFLIYNLFINKETTSLLFILLLSTLLIFQSLWDSIQSIAFGNERMQSAGYINLLFTAIWVASVYVIPKENFNLNVILSIYVLTQVLKTVSYYYWLNSNILSKDQSLAGNSEITIKTIISQSNFFFILAVFTAIQNQVPILFLNQMSTVDQVGIFNLGNRILSPMQLALNMALTSLYPSFSRLALTNKKLFTERIMNLINLIVIVGVCCCICFTLFSKEVVVLLYGEPYLESARVILIQCWFTVLFAVFCTIGMVLSSFDKQKLLAILSIIYGVIGVPFFLIGSKSGAIGLAWAFVIAGFLNMTYHWVVFKNLLSSQITIGYSVRLFSFLIIATIGSLYIPFEFSLIVKLIIGLSVTILAGFYIKIKVLHKILN